ncbi:MAG: Uma2 family endonuclease [Actinomycetota bacterium]|nr:Uma2 family endonuclease [Actinomycetota bacterium]
MSSRDFGGFGGEGFDFEHRPEVDAWLRDRATDAPTAATRFEWLDGDQVALPPVTAAHAACTNRLAALFQEVLGATAIVSVQNPVLLDESSRPCPDVALLVPREDGYRETFPTVADIIVLVEVADSTFGLTHTRGRKASLYARCGITECWIVDLVSAQVLVHRTPASGGYRDIRNLRGEAMLAPVGRPEALLSAGAVLGPAGTA